MPTKQVAKTNIMRCGVADCSATEKYATKTPNGWFKGKTGLTYCPTHASQKKTKKKSKQNITVTCKFLSHYLINTLAVHFGGESVLDLVIPEPTPSKTSNSKNKYRLVLISNL